MKTPSPLTATGGVLTSAGVILAGTFLILLSQPVKDLAEISIGVALGVLIDTFLVRTALVPGLTLWVGPKAGWPGPRWMTAMYRLCWKKKQGWSR